MSLFFSGPRGSVEQRWIVFALLRDNIQHHLEGGHPTPEFEAIHSVSRALGGGSVALSARQLRREVEKAHAALAGRPRSDLAVSRLTSAVIDGTWAPAQQDTHAPTMLSAESVPWLADGIQGLDQVFGHLVRALLEITEGAGESDVVEVVDC